MIVLPRSPLGPAALAILAAVSLSPAAGEQRVAFAGESQPAGAPAISGYLTKPLGAGPFAAAVLLHSCLGLPRNRREIADRIAGWGYVALFVDDFSSRDLKETCAADFGGARSDAFGALAFLAALPYVDPKRVAAIGFSQGADTALAISNSKPLLLSTPPAPTRRARCFACQRSSSSARPTR